MRKRRRDRVGFRRVPAGTAGIRRRSRAPAAVRRRGRAGAAPASCMSRSQTAWPIVWMISGSASEADHQQGAARRRLSTRARAGSPIVAATRLGNPVTGSCPAWNRMCASRSRIDCAIVANAADSCADLVAARDDRRRACNRPPRSAARTRPAVSTGRDTLRAISHAPNSPTSRPSANRPAHASADAAIGTQRFVDRISEHGDDRRTLSRAVQPHRLRDVFAPAARR